VHSLHHRHKAIDSQFTVGHECLDNKRQNSGRTQCNRRHKRTYASDHMYLVQPARDMHEPLPLSLSLSVSVSLSVCRHITPHHTSPPHPPDDQTHSTD